MAAPLFILAPGRSYTSLVSAMLGQHPEMCGLLELNLNATDTMQEWWATFRSGMGVNAHGLLRTVAQLQFGEQTEPSITEAWHWLRARLHWATSTLHRMLIESIDARGAVEKCPVAVHGDVELERLLQAFPDARFLHLIRHPRSTCNSIVQTEWARMMFVASFPDMCDFNTNPPTVDPQMLWYQSHARIRDFVDRLPEYQTFRIRGESLLAELDRYLREICDWLGLRRDDAAIDEMMHPERSPFSCVGPRNAFAGADIGFLESPEMRPFKAKAESLAGALPWRADGNEFWSEVQNLAREFGYE